MVYKIAFDSFTKISEQAGTIQNVGDYVIEMSETPAFDNGILILPNQKSTFNNTDIYLRCVEEGFVSEVRVVPFIVDKGGGDDSAVDSYALKSVALDGNTLNFFASTDTAQTAAFSIDIPAEQFLDQATTNFVPNFLFSAILYSGATNPNLDGKPVIVLGVKTKSNDGLTENISYSFIDVSHLVDTYTASDTSVIVSDYKFKVNISSDAGNTLKLKSNGLYADGVTDTATSSTFGLTKLYGNTGTNTDGTITQAAITTELNSKASTDTATTTAAGLMSAPDKIKLDGIENSAQVNIIESVKVNNAALPVTNKSVNIDLSGKLDSDATAQSAYKDSAGNVITDTYVTKTELSRKLGAVRYGYRIKKSEPDPDLRVEYLYDAAGMSPAHMIVDTDTNTAGTDSDTSYFDFGDWGNVWFIRDVKPLMLKTDGTVDYYLNPNDYTKKADGTSSDVANEEYDGNAMAQYPLVWIYRYEDDTYYYEIVSNVQWDENYKAYAHTDYLGNIKNYFYLGLYPINIIDNVARSLQKDYVYYSGYDAFNSAAALGSNYSNVSWSQREFFRTLETLCFKKSGDYYFEYLFPTTQKFSTINLVAGAFISNRKFYVKMTPPYSTSVTSDYTHLKTYNAMSGAWISQMTCGQYGMYPVAWNGSSSTYFQAQTWIANNSSNLYALTLQYNRNSSGRNVFNGARYMAYLAAFEHRYTLAYV